MPISQNTALFSLLGTTYGGDGKSNFALPNLKDQVVMGPGQGPGLSLYDLGQVGGQSSITLLQSEIPMHNHSVQSVPVAANSTNPGVIGAAAGGRGTRTPAMFYTATNPSSGKVVLNPQTVGIAGNSIPFGNTKPILALNFCIALQGVFPARS